MTENNSARDKPGGGTDTVAADATPAQPEAPPLLPPPADDEAREKLRIGREYPPHREADVLASDGRVVLLRPMTPDDAQRLVDFHGGLSARTRFLRYFGPYPVITPRDLHRFVVVDHKYREALIMLLGDEIIAVGRYEHLPEGDGLSAEVAFVVADSHQGRGLGPILLEHLAAAAGESGLHRFVADVLAENQAMLTVFQQAGYTVERRFEEGVIRLEFAIDPNDVQVTVRNRRESAAEARNVGNMLRPRSVAVIGASADPNKVGNVVLTNLLRAGFTGPVFPVHAERTSVAGVRAYPSVRDIPDDVDLAVAAVPADAIDAVLDDCLEKGVRAIVIVSSGFSEAGNAGRQRERALVRAARAHGMRVVGPAALGVANTDPAISLNATLAPRMPSAGRIGFFCQSGALGIAILDQAATRGLGLSTFVSAGNRADLSGNDLLQYWDTDDATDMVLLYLETLGNARKFTRIARRVSRRKPIIAVKSGRGAAPPSVASGAAVDDTIVRTLFEQVGVIQVGSISELFDTAALIGYQPLPQGPRVAVVSNSTALGVLAVVSCRRAGLDAFDPIDVGAAADGHTLAVAVAEQLRRHDVDSVIAVFVPPVTVRVSEFASELLGATSGSDKPVLTTFLAAEGIPDVLARGIDESGGVAGFGSIPSYPDPDRAVAALARAWRYVAWRATPEPRPVRPDGIDRAAARVLIDGFLEKEPSGGELSDVDTAKLLRCYGLELPAFKRVDNAEDAVAAAEEIGYPVVVKALDVGWRHRPDLGGVRLDLTGVDAVRQAYNDLTAEIGSPWVQVQVRVPKGIGCSVRANDDPAFGPLVSFGLSGVIPALFNDRSYAVVPISREEAVGLVDAPRAAPLLNGDSTREGVDKSAVADVVERIATLVSDFPEVPSIVCDPILSSPDGAFITDARAWVRPEDTNAEGPRRLW